MGSLKQVLLLSYEQLARLSSGLISEQESDKLQLNSFIGSGSSKEALAGGNMVLVSSVVSCLP